MSGEAYSNGETEVRETITMVRDEGEGQRKVGSTLLSSVTVGLGCCASLVPERLLAAFAIIIASQRRNINA